MQQIKERLAAPYKSDDTVEIDFVEEFKSETRMVSEAELGKVEDALLQLDKKVRTLQNYTVQSGDTLVKIAILFDTTVDKLCADTPGLTLSRFLQIGETIKVETTKPYLSVKTIDEITKTETIPYQTTRQENPLQSTSYTNVIQEGRDGQVVKTVRVTRINGIIEGQEDVIDEEITVTAMERIEEVGVLETPLR